MDTSDTLNGAFEEDNDNETAAFVRHEKKGDHQLVAGVANDADEEDPSISQCGDDSTTQPETLSQRCLSWWNHNWMPDSGWTWRGIVVLEAEAIRFVKFLTISGIGIVIMHYLVQWLNWEHDSDYNLKDLVLYDLNMIILDMLVFFIVGRLHRQRAIDYAAWVLPCALSALYTSWSTNFRFLQYSFSLYEMHCHWPWKLWMFCLFMVPLVIWVLWIHVQYAARHGTLVRKMVELALSLTFFIIPYASHPNFHLHHWYLGWLLGMHANLDVWWSRATMAYLWGFYINGIAVYGRDPILTCAYSYYVSTDLRCPYMACYVPNHDDNSTAHQDYKPMVEPDWRNCTGYIP